MGVDHVAATPLRADRAPQFPVIMPNRTTGWHRALVVNLVRSDGLVAPRDVVLARHLEAAAGLHVMSRGLLTVEVELFERDVSVPFGSDICSHTSALTAAVAAELNVAASWSAYRFISFVLPVDGRTDRCAFGGLGMVTGVYSWNVARLDMPADAQPSARVVMHEWGHNLGLLHANYLQCSVDGQPIALATRADRLAGACKPHEYGGEWSVMGRSVAAAITAGERRHLGWLREGEQTSVSDAVVTLGVDGPVSLVWLQNSEGDLFQVEFVKPTRSGRFFDFVSGGWTSHAPQPGVIVKYVEPPMHSGTTYVLDTRPETGVLADAPLLAMQNWTDATGTVSVSVLSGTGDSATVAMKGTPIVPGAVPSVSVTPLRETGVAYVSWAAAPSALRVVRYEIGVLEGDEQREVQVLTVEGIQATVRLTNMRRHERRWIVVRGINELGIAGEASAPVPVTWNRVAKPGNPGAAGKPCGGKRASNPCS